MRFVKYIGFPAFLLCLCASQALAHQVKPRIEQRCLCGCVSCRCERCACEPVEFVTVKRRPVAGTVKELFGIPVKWLMTPAERVAVPVR